MKDFRRQNGQGNGRNDGFERREQSNDFRGPRRDFDNRSGEKFKGSRNDGSMHKAICSECSKACEVPFTPSGNKPVYCSDCFGKKKGAQGGGYEKREFAPRGPVSHEARPPMPPQMRDTRIDELKAQVDSMNSKIDRMMKILLETTPAQKMVNAVMKEEKKVVEVAKKAVAKVAKKVLAKTKTKKKK